MNKKSILLFIGGLGFGLLSFAQTTVINYESWNPSSPPCNIFTNTVAVPATVNGANTTINHQSTAGQPTYTNNAILLVSSYNPSGQVYKGTEYQIQYNFLQGYNYSITVNVRTYSGNQNSDPKLVLNPSSGLLNNSNCVGPELIDINTTGGNRRSLSITNPTFADSVYQLNIPCTVSGNVFTVKAICPSNSSSITRYIEIKKITIVATLANASFSLAPATNTFNCGTTISPTFIVSNLNCSPGTLSYNWNLGTTPNGWLLGGSPAPQFTTTSSNTLSLVSSSSAPTVKNVQVTPLFNGTNQATLTSAVTVTPTVPSGGSYNISGISTLCSGNSDYSISNLGSSSVSSWVATPTGIVTISNSANIGTLTRVGNGVVTLRANIVDACGFTTQTNPITINVGGPAKPYAIAINFNGSYDETTPIELSRFKTYSAEVLYPSEGEYQWSLTNVNLLTGQGTQEISMKATASTNTPIAISVVGVNACGAGNPLVVEGIVVTANSGLRQALPTINFTQMGNIILLQLPPLLSNTKERALRIIDKVGKVVKQFVTDKTATDIIIDISSFKADFYYVQFFDGKNIVTKPIFKY